MTELAWICLALAAVPCALAGANLMQVSRPRVQHKREGKVSVLVPARNEEQNIGAAIDSILASRDVELELIVCDDDSTDRTGEIVRERALRDARVRMIHAAGPATGQFGKPAACQHLADVSTGDILVFIDADVRIAADSLAALAATLTESPAALISGIPRQETRSWSERLVVPLMDFILYGFLPIHLMRSRTHPAFGAACGQLIAVKRGIYREVGGHAAIAQHVHDGIALARLFRMHGHGTDLIDATRLANCRMYSSWRELRDGFAKNAHEGLGSPRGIVPWTLVLSLGQVVPFVLVPAVWSLPGARVPMIVAAALALLTRVLLAGRFRHDWLSVLGHPAGIAILIALQWYALFRRVTHRPTEWKGRQISAA